MTCRFSWCAADHDDSRWAEAHRSEPAVIGSLTVYALLVEDGPRPDGMVRVHGSHLHLEFNPAVAESIARMLAQVEGAQVAAVATAVRAAADVLIEAGGQQ